MAEGNHQVEVKTEKKLKPNETFPMDPFTENVFQCAVKMGLWFCINTRIPKSTGIHPSLKGMPL